MKTMRTKWSSAKRGACVPWILVEAADEEMAYKDRTVAPDRRGTPDEERDLGGRTVPMLIRKSLTVAVFGKRSTLTSRKTI